MCQIGEKEMEKKNQFLARKPLQNAYNFFLTLRLYKNYFCNISLNLKKLHS